MATMGKYDGNLQMFVHSPREVDLTRLSFMRWLAEAGRLEHQVEGPSSGPLADVAKARSSPREPLAA